METDTKHTVQNDDILLIEKDEKDSKLVTCYVVMNNSHYYS